MEMELKEYRCFKNSKLLCKAGGEWQIEILNPTNRVMNYTWPSRVHQDRWLKGREFQQHAVDLNCKGCSRLLWRAIGMNLVVETKCRHCKTVTFFDLEVMHSARLAPLSKVARNNVLKKQKEVLSILKMN